MTPVPGTEPGTGAVREGHAGAEDGAGERPAAGGGGPIRRGGHRGFCAWRGGYLVGMRVRELSVGAEYPCHANTSPRFNPGPWDTRGCTEMKNGACRFGRGKQPGDTFQPPSRATTFQRLPKE